jgi:hypothetical protein
MMSAVVVLGAWSTVGAAAQSPDGLVTEEVEPGVERVIRDDAGHDLDVKHPTHRYDMDGIAIAPDGTIWLATTYSRSDNQANPDGPLVWALGLPGTLSVDARAQATGPVSIFELPDGGSVVMAWGALAAMSDGDSTWTLLDEIGTDSEPEVCRLRRGTGVICVASSGEETTYLAGTRINQVATSPDGTVWAVGGYDGDNGGLYRITRD